jgi:GAF domain-containing protein
LAFWISTAPPSRFTAEDEQGLAELVAHLEKLISATDYQKIFAHVAG